MTELTLATLEDFVRANKFAVVHFLAPWNGYDVEMKKLLATQIPQDLSPNFVIGTLNIDSVEHNHLSRFHGSRICRFWPSIATDCWSMP